MSQYEHGGPLKIKIHILIYGENSRNVALSQMQFCTLKYHEHTYNFYFNHYFLDGAFECGGISIL
jgi:hypothetical protein